MTLDPLELQHKPDKATLDPRGLKYSIARAYRAPNQNTVTSICQPYGAVGDGLIPNRIEFDHWDATRVKCYAIDRVSEIDERNKDNLSNALLTINYVGYVWRPCYWEADISTAGEQLISSLPQGDPPRSEQIGTNAEGTTVQRPRVRMTIVENVSRNVFEATKLNLIQRIAGTVNEASWDPAILVDVASFLEGTWLYLGARAPFVGSETYVLTHEFLSIPPVTGGVLNAEMQFYKWRSSRSEKRNVTIDGQTVEREFKVYGDEETSKVYPIAGTDTIYPFSLLEL